MVGASYGQNLDCSEQKIRCVLMKFEDAYNQHNIEIADSIYSAEAMVYGPSMIMEGWARYKEIWSGFLKESQKVKFNLNNDLQVQIYGSTALACGTWHEEYWDDAGKPNTLDGRITFVLKKQDTKWVIVHQHASVPFKY